MREDILKELRKITPEEQAILTAPRTSIPPSTTWMRPGLWTATGFWNVES